MIINHEFDIENVGIDFTSVVKANDYITGNCIVYFVDDTESTLFFSAKYVEYNKSYSVVVDFDKNEAEQDVKWEDNAKKLVEELLTENLIANSESLESLSECALKEDVENLESDIDDKEIRNIDNPEDQIFVAKYLVKDDEAIFDSHGVECTVELENMPFEKVKEVIKHYNPDLFLSGPAYPDDIEFETVYKDIKVEIFIGYANDLFESYLESKGLIKSDGSFNTAEFYEKCYSNDFYDYLVKDIEDNWNPSIYLDSDNEDQDTFNIYDLI